MEIEGYLKHKNLIELWSQGTVIELESQGKWQVPDFYIWGSSQNYRIKPFEPKQGEVILVKRASCNVVYKRIFVRKTDNEKGFICIAEDGNRTWLKGTEENVLTSTWKIAEPIK